jgi:PAS domain S-box-containing protein
MLLECLLLEGTMILISHKIKFAISGALIVPLFGRIALHGTNYEYDLYRYFMPLIVGTFSGYLIGLMKDKWLVANKNLTKTNEVMKQEIEEHKLSRKALQESKGQSKRYLEAIDSMGMGLFIVNSDYHIRHMNKTMIKWFGDKRGLICHQSISGLGSPCTYCKLKSVIKSNRIVHYTPVTPDGRSFDILCYPIQNTDGSISKMGIFRDITEMTKAAETLRESEKRFLLLSESLADIVYEFDSKEKFTYVNEAGVRIFGYSKDELLGKIQVRDTITKEEYARSKEAIGEIFKGKTIVEERTFIRKDGSIFVGEIHSGPIYKGKNVIGARGIIRDITERKQAEEEREKLINKLQEALEDVKTLSGLLPICANCKKIRDDKGYWNQIEGYIQKYSEVKFSHGMCPECSDKLYGDEDWYIDMKKKEKGRRQ